MKYDFGNPDHFAVLTRQAFAGTVDVSGFPPAAYRYFDSLRRLYAAYRDGGIGEDEARQRKTRLLEDYRQATAAYAEWKAVCAEYQNAVRTAGTLTSEIEKSDDVFEIAQKACEIISLLTGEPSFAKRQAVKIGEARMQWAR